VDGKCSKCVEGLCLITSCRGGVVVVVVAVVVVVIFGAAAHILGTSGGGGACGCDALTGDAV